MDGLRFTDPESWLNPSLSAHQSNDRAVDYGGIDGHHKAWVIDQMVRALTGDDYEKVVTDAKDGEDGPDTYEWNEGIHHNRKGK